MGGGKTSTSTQSVQIPPEVLARYNAVNARAESVAAQPFMQYPGQFVAGLSPTQQAGIQATSQLGQSAQPFYQAGTELTLQGAQGVGPLTRGQIGYYQDPYTEAVVQPTLAALRQQQGQERAQQQAQAIRSGAFGGDRAGLERANLARQQTLGTAQAIAPLYSQGYQTGLQTAAGQQGVIAQDLQRRLAAGQQIAGLGTGMQQTALQGAQAQIAAGTLEQQTQQADLTARYQQFLQERGYPFQVAQFLANIAMGTGALSGSTTTTTQPAGFFSDRRLKDDVAPIGKTFDGQTIYRYKYKGDDRTQIGLMADEVQKRHPEAVGLHSGYKTVDYKEATDDAARAKKAGGGLVGADDMRAILEAQRAGFGPFGQQGGPYGGASQGMPMGKAGLGYVPQGSLPVPKLVTAAGLGAQRPSGLSEAANTGRSIAELAKMGRDLKNWATEKPAEQQPKKGPPAPTGVSVKEVKVEGAPASDMPSAKAKPVSSDEMGLGAGFREPGTGTEMFDAMGFSAGGLVPSYASGGSINPYDADKNPMDYFPEEVLEEGETGKKELPKPGQAPGRGKSGASEALNLAGSLASMIPGVGTAVGTGMKFASMFMADGGVVDGGTFAYGGLVPRRGYATDGAVEEVPVETVAVEEKPIFDLERAKRAIAANESGGRYEALGPVTGRGDRAYGKYQVMGSNIPSWTEEALGTRMTPEEYLANPEAQEKTFAHHFGKFATQHGNPYDAASVWFSGKPIAEAGNRRDVLGTTVPSYVSKFKSTYDAEGDMPSRGAQPVQYSQGLGGGRREEPTIGRTSSLGDVADRFLPEGIPTSSNFWVPALGFVGSMLASNRPTLGGAIGEGIVGGVGAFQEQRKQQADLARVVLDIADKQFVVQPDPNNPNETLYFNRRTGQQLTAGQYAQAIAAIGEGLGVPRSVFGIGEQGGVKPPSAPAVTGAAEPKDLPAPTTKVEAAPAKEAAPTETKGTEWMSLPPDQVNWEGKTPAQAEQYVLRYKQDFGLVGTKDPDALAEAEKQKREQAEGFRRQGNTAMVQELIQEADKLKERRQEYIKQATSPLLETAKKGLEQKQDSNIKFFTELGTGSGARAEAITQLEQLAKSLELLQTNRLAEWKANFQALAKSIGLPIESTAGMDATQAQIAMKEAWRSVFSRLAEIGGQPRVVEIQGLKDSGANIALEPGANRKIIASGLAALRYADKFTQDAIAERDRVGINKFDQAKFTTEWRKENDRSKFTEEFEKNLAVRGDIPLRSDGNIDYGKLKDGYLYIIEPQFSGRSEPIKMRAQRTKDGKMELVEER